MRRYRIVLVSLFVPVTVTVVALLGRWGAENTAIALPAASVIQLAYLGALWRASDQRLRTTFTAGTIVVILLLSLELSVLRLFQYAVGGLPVTIVLAQTILLWACALLVELIGTNLRLTRISQVVGLAAVLGAGVIAFVLHDYQQLVLFALFPAAFFSVRTPANRLALGIAFFLGIALELFGTFIEAWEWSPGVLELPMIGRGFANPPYGAGGLYALSVALTVLVARWLEPSAEHASNAYTPRRNRRRQETPPVPEPEGGAPAGVLDSH